MQTFGIRRVREATVSTPVLIHCWLSKPTKRTDQGWHLLLEYNQSSFTRALLCSLVMPSPEDLIVWFGNLLLSEDPLRTIQELEKTTQRQEDAPIILECHDENM